VNEKKFYPVIHCVATGKGGIDHAFDNVRTAVRNGADGVFLIGHAVHHSELCQIYDSVRRQFPALWIGINFLDIAASNNWIDLFSAARACAGLNGLWLDRLPDSRLNISPGVQIFGGVAFKYIDPHASGQALVIACEKAVQNVDVATTSGDKTGSAPDQGKVESIKIHLAGRIPLAVASGVSAQNAAGLLPFVDIFLVASSLIERDANRGGHEYLVPEKVRELADIVHSYKAE
jgi:hypothetical protein